MDDHWRRCDNHGGRGDYHGFDDGRHHGLNHRLYHGRHDRLYNRGHDRLYHGRHDRLYNRRHNGGRSHDRRRLDNDRWIGFHGINDIGDGVDNAKCRPQVLVRWIVVMVVMVGADIAADGECCENSGEQ